MDYNDNEILLKRSYLTGQNFYKGVMDFVSDIIAGDEKQLAERIIQRAGDKNMDLFYGHAACVTINDLQTLETPQAKEYKKIVEVACARRGISYGKLVEKSKIYKARIEQEMETIIQHSGLPLPTSEAIYSTFLLCSDLLPSMNFSENVAVVSSAEILFRNNLTYLALDANDLGRGAPHNEISEGIWPHIECV